MYRVALSAASHSWRRRPGLGPDALEERHDPAPPPPDCLVHQEQLLRLRRAVVALPERQARAVLLRYLEEREYDAVALEMGCSPAAARSHVSKALAALRRQLNGLPDKV